jgi:octaprenyl-diphosphate synthase
MCGYTGALAGKVGAVIEMVHTASLLHDDVIDEATQRRGQASANTIYGNAATVLSGDYLYTSAFLMLVELTDIDFSRVVMQAVGAMSEGELLQLQKTGNIALSMDDYLTIIYGKTAALFSASCQCGALLGNKSMQERMIDYGRSVGYAFQMQDDVLDYFGDEKVTGKRPGTDLSEKKVTIPMLLLFQEASAEDGELAKALFLSDSPLEERLAGLLALFDKYKIHDKSSLIVKSHIDKALGILDLFDASLYRDALVILTESLNNRES